MYKIYFGERFLLITSKSKDFNETNSRLAADVRDLLEFVTEFDSFTTLKWYALLSENPLDVIMEIKKVLPCIEAGGGVVKNQHGEVLVIFRYGKWDLPKGKREEGEGFEDCALREVAEECGIKGHRIEKKLVATYHTYKIKNKIFLKHTEWFAMDYSGPLSCKPQLEEDISQALWVAKSSLHEVYENTYQSVIDVLEEAAGNKQSPSIV